MDGNLSPVLDRPAMTIPAPGHPCNGCGACCRIVTCADAEARYGRLYGGCPDLVERDGRTYCQAALDDPAGAAERFLVGVGCTLSEGVRGWVGRV